VPPARDPNLLTAVQIRHGGQTFEECYMQVLGEKKRRTVTPDGWRDHREMNAARMVLFIDLVRADAPLPRDLLQQFANVFEDIMEGAKFEATYPLPQRARQGRAAKRAAISSLVEQRGPNEKMAAVYERVGSDLDISIEPESVKKALQRMKKKQ
jgi:hypothetical protein